jgi:hypothetical protein
MMNAKVKKVEKKKYVSVPAGGINVGASGFSVSVSASACMVRRSAFPSRHTAHAAEISRVGTVVRFLMTIGHCAHD